MKNIEQSPTNNSTFVDNELQLNSHLEDSNETNDWKTTNNHEGELVMAYNINAGNNALRLRTFYVLYIGPNDDSNGHLIYKLSTNTWKYVIFVIKETTEWKSFIEQWYPW